MIGNNGCRSYATGVYCGGGKGRHIDKVIATTIATCQLHRNKRRIVCAEVRGVYRGRKTGRLSHLIGWILG